MRLPSGIQADVQGLRGIAVLIVVLYHAGTPWLSGGYVGVDIFFVISGYLITGLLVRERDETGSIDFAQFYARRARRLLPAAFVAFAVTLVIGRFLYAPFEQLEVATGGLSAALYVSNFWFASRATDYFGGNAENDPFLHTWSLAVEEQFYLVWPALLALGLIGAPRHHVRLRLLATILAVSLVSYLACRHLTWKSQPWAFFGMHTRAWEFGIGALAFLLVEHSTRIPARLLRAAGWAGMVCIVIATFSFNRRTMFPGSAAALPALGAFLLIVAGRAPRPSAPTALLGARPMVWLGDISYSWYLWHWPVLVFASMATDGREFAVTAAAVALSIFVAQLSYRAIENPLRFSPYFTSRTSASLVGAILLTIGSATLALAIRFDAEAASSTEAQRQISAARQDRPSVYGTECHARFDRTAAPECVFGVGDSRHEVALFGDSHAAHWFPALEELALKRNWRLLSLTKSACPSVVVTVFSKVKRRDYVECDQWRSSMIERILDRKPALVVISNSNSYVNTASDQLDGVVTLVDWERGLGTLVSRFLAAGIAVLIVRDTPSPGFDVPLCLARAAMGLRGRSQRCAFDLPAVNDPLQRLIEIEDAIARRTPGVIVADLNALICPQRVCNVEQAGQIVFSDGEHLTGTFSRKLSPHILGYLQKYSNANPQSRVAALADEP